MNNKVLVKPSMHEFTVNHGETVLDAAIRQGLGLPYNCRDGACGTCKGQLISGETEYQEGVLPEGIDKHLHEQGLRLFCQALAKTDLVIEIEELVEMQGLRIKTLPCRVMKLEKLCHNVERLYLKLPTTHTLNFLAGQYIDILLKDGRKRSFSIANAPHEGQHIELHIRHVPDGAFSDHILPQIQEKAILRIRAPLGSFYLREDSDRPILFLAGGTGFAPIKGIIEHAFHIGVDRPMHLFWGVENIEDLYLAELPNQWAQDKRNFDYTPVLSNPPSDGSWQGEQGLVTEALLNHYDDLAAFDIYAGGPPGMVHHGADLFFAAGLPPQHYYSDSFEYAKDKTK